MSQHQPGILDDVPRNARYLTFQRVAGEDPRPALRRLGRRGWHEDMVVGLGPGLVSALDRSIAGLRPFPALVNRGIAVPSTPADLWVWLQGDDLGELVHATRALEAELEDALGLEGIVDGFRHATGRDLTGYADGTENPTGEDALDAAIVVDGPEGMRGSSFVSVQQWVHDLDAFEGYPEDVRDEMIGRTLADDEELDDAPPSAHVKRTAQESFTPEAFVVRRSMAWADGEGEGLVFVSFAHTLDHFERLLRRMMGFDDDVTDALFRFTSPSTGAHFWCPPVRNGMLDLRAVGL